MTEPAPLTLLIMIHRFEPRGGQELSTWEVALRLAAAGWQIEVWSYRCGDWPKEWPLRFVRIPGFWIPTQILRSFWYLLHTTAMSLVQRRRHAVRLTLGTATGRADVRVIQFVSGAYQALVRRGLAELPNARNGARRLYQRLYLAFNARQELRLLPQSRLLIPISDCVERELAASPRIAQVPMCVVRHGGDGIVAPPQGSPRFRDRVPIVLFVGALERKGIRLALEALAPLRALPWRFEVVGGGNLRAWQALAATLGIGERVRFHGETPARSHYERADVFLFPSAYEPFGLVVMEAMAAGLALVCSRECGAMELWGQCPDWLGLSAQEPAARWTEALRRLLTAPDVCRDAVVSAQRAMGTRTWDVVAAEFDAALRRVAKRVPGTPD